MHRRLLLKPLRQRQLLDAPLSIQSVSIFLESEARPEEEVEDPIEYFVISLLFFILHLRFITGILTISNLVFL
jgi:hypothetical protein